jgi:hypothetical protein
VPPDRPTSAIEGRAGSTHVGVNVTLFGVANFDLALRKVREIARRGTSMFQKQGPTEERIRAAIEAKIDRLMALEELPWELQSFVEDLWGPVPNAWSERSAELAAVIARDQPRVSGEAGGAAWEAGRARILEAFTPQERWLIGLSEHLWNHAFDGAREAIRRAAVESFLAATQGYLREHPEVPPLAELSSRLRATRTARARGSRRV